eukprot:1071777-Prymnesium_polylepis.1
MQPVLHARVANVVGRCRLAFVAGPLPFGFYGGPGRVPAERVRHSACTRHIEGWAVGGTRESMYRSGSREMGARTQIAVCPAVSAVRASKGGETTERVALRVSARGWPTGRG